MRLLEAFFFHVNVTPVEIIFGALCEPNQQPDSFVEIFDRIFLLVIFMIESQTFVVVVGADVLDTTALFL